MIYGNGLTAIETPLMKSIELIQNRFDATIRPQNHIVSIIANSNRFDTSLGTNSVAESLMKFNYNCASLNTITTAVSASNLLQQHSSNLSFIELAIAACNIYPQSCLSIASDLTVSFLKLSTPEVFKQVSKTFSNQEVVSYARSRYENFISPDINPFPDETIIEESIEEIKAFVKKLKGNPLLLKALQEELKQVENSSSEPTNCNEIDLNEETPNEWEYKNNKALLNLLINDCNLSYQSAHILTTIIDKLALPVLIAYFLSIINK